MGGKCEIGGFGVIFSIQVTSIHLLTAMHEQGKKLRLFSSSSESCQAGHWYS